MRRFLGSGIAVRRLILRDGANDQTHDETEDPMYRFFLSKVRASHDVHPELVALILETCEALSDRRYRTQRRVIAGRREVARRVVQGLLDLSAASSWSFVPSDQPTSVLCLPLSQHGYSHGPLKGLSRVAALDVIQALEYLQLIEVRKGHYAGDHLFQSEIWPTQAFLRSYGQILQWLPRKVSEADPIVLKNYDAATKKKYALSFSDTPEIRRMRKNLRRINQALLDSVIALAVDEFRLWWIRHQMARSDYLSDLSQGSRMLSFQSVELRRVFARKSFKLGGRFYGGWWQSIPSRYRPYITINGQVTVELDFSTLHPLLMYAEFGVEPPEGDFYDLGYDGPDKARARKIFKQAFNALINDASGYYQTPKDDQLFIGMTNAEIRQAIITKHPLVKKIIGKGRGLKYQFTDSKIAESVMLRLLSQGIICLPVHDSFIVIAEYEPQLRQAMIEAFEQIVGGAPVLKLTEIGRSSFEPVFYPSGKLDLTYLRNLESTSPYHQFHRSYFDQPTNPHPGAPIPLSARNVEKSE